MNIVQYTRELEYWETEDLDFKILLNSIADMVYWLSITDILTIFFVFSK